MNFLDNVTYGNLSLKHKEISSRPDKVSQKLIKIGLYDRLFEMPSSENSSSETKNELNRLVKNIENLNDITLQFCIAAEKDHVRMFIEYLERYGVSDITQEELLEVQSEIQPLLFRLKEHYNRPRPYQLANYYDLDLYVPIETTNASSPAYPSGHSFEGYVMAELLAKRYSEHAVGLLKLGKNIGLSRLMIGVHYPSDHKFARYVGALIIENNLVQL